ncbi:MAG: ABC transporter permease [Minicystis sp.]
MGMVSGRRRAIAETAAEIHHAAVAPLPVLLALAAALGAGVLAVLAALLRPNGVRAGLPAAVSYAIVREVIPPLCAAVILARSGPAITAAIGRGSRRARRVIATRVAGAALASLGLAAILTVAALAGAAIAARALGLATVGVDLRRLLGTLTAASLVAGLGKACVLGLAIAAVGCAHGLRARGSPGAWVRAGGRGVVHAALACVALDVALSLSPLLAR